MVPQPPPALPPQLLQLLSQPQLSWPRLNRPCSFSRRPPPECPPQVSQELPQPPQPLSQPQLLVWPCAVNFEKWLSVSQPQPQSLELAR